MSQIIMPGKLDSEDISQRLLTNAMQFDHLPGPGENVTIRFQELGEPLRIERGRVMDINRPKGLLEVKLSDMTVLCHITDIVKVG
jgi:hypothetical protein